MKIKFIFAMILTACAVHGQGTLIVDQQAPSALGTFAVQGNTPLGESFTPALSSVGFIQVDLNDATANGLGAIVTVDLMSGSITGTILGSSTVAVPDGFLGESGDTFGPTFYFSTPVMVAPGKMYYFDINVQSGGDILRVGAGPGGYYAGGTGYANGVASSGFNLQFTEGIVSAPEPSVGWLVLLGGGAFFAWRRWQTELF